jgi:hypothetical protein
MSGQSNSPVFCGLSSGAQGGFFLRKNPLECLGFEPAATGELLIAHFLFGRNSSPKSLQNSSTIIGYGPEPRPD